MGEVPQSQIEKLKEAWDAAQPLSSESDRALWRKLRLEWNFHSNHIEGNTLTYGETQLLLLHGQTSGSHDLREYEEMKAHDVAISQVREMAEDPRPITEADVRDLNRILLKESFWKEAITADGQPTRKEIIPGQYKVSPNNVRTATGDIFQFSTPEETPIRMAELIEWFRNELEDKEADLVKVLAVFHHRFSVIHPFDDGNGRTMRLLVNYALLRKGYPPLVIRSQDKKEYLGKLHEADAGNLEPFVEFLEKQVLNALDLGLRSARGESLEEPEDWEKEMALFVRNYERKEVPERTDERLEEIAINSWLPALHIAVEKLESLNRLFHSKTISVDYDGHYFGSLSNVTFLTMTSLLDVKQILIKFSFQEFSHPNVRPFDVDYILKFDMSRYHYEILEDQNSIPLLGRLRYDLSLSEPQIEKISSVIAQSIFRKTKDLTDLNTIAVP